MTLLVFAGPSFPPGELREQFPEFSFAEPAQCGDVYRAARQRPVAIGLLDGYFDHRLSVWHKEILWALAQGIPVYGAASMGALRAAELDVYGMIGVGVVYHQFQSGELEDDDEVAVVHGPRERGYAAQSEALVNIRATLRAALSAGAIDSASEAALITAAKSLFYAERTFDTVIAASAIATPERRSLQAWLQEHGPVDQKRSDAVSLLERMRRDAQHGPPRLRKVPSFERTSFWQVFEGNFAPRGAEPGPASLAARCERRALERALSLLLAERVGAEPSPEEIQAESERIRAAQGLFTEADTERWLRANALDLAGFSALARDEVLVRRFRRAARRLARAQLVSSLALRRA
ncbi:MAG TPA: TfuA-like protein [Polyangiaceae bacterium]|nr:TfuA-like protein [Polyangiaceae bacterium]